jgi:hypothetical protein
LLALSGNAKARKCRLQRSCILALTEPAKRQILGAGKICLFAQENHFNSQNFQGAKSYLYNTYSHQICQYKMLLIIS